MSDEFSPNWIQRNCADLKPSTIRAALSGVSNNSTSTIVLASVGAAMIVVGMGSQVITLNKWLKNFPAASPTGEAVGGPYTVLLCTSFLVFLKFFIGMVGWYIAKRPDMSFAFQLRTYKWILVTGVLSALNGLLVVYATNNTPEVIQAILVSSQILFTLFFSAVFKLNKGRSYCHVLVLGSVLMCCGGIALGMASGMSGMHFDKDTAAWAALFMAGIIPAAATNVTTAVFFRQVIADDGEPKENNKIEGEYLLGHAQSLEPGIVEPNPHRDPDQLLTDSSTAKFFFLTCVTLGMSVFTVALFPMDWAPFFGQYAGSSSTSVTALKNGFKCISNRIDGCDHCLLFFFLFALSYAVANAGNAIVNRFSAPLAALLSQVSSPMVAVLIVIFPVLDATSGGSNSNQLGPNIGAVLLIVIGAVMFTLWEQISLYKQRTEKALSPS